MQVGAVASGVQLGCRWSARVKGRIAYCGAAGPQIRTMHTGPVLSEIEILNIRCLASDSATR